MLASASGLGPGNRLCGQDARAQQSLHGLDVLPLRDKPVGERASPGMAGAALEPSFSGYTRFYRVFSESSETYRQKNTPPQLEPGGVLGF